MRTTAFNGRRYVQFERLADEAGLMHAYSTRGLNVSVRPGADSEQRAANRATMARDLGATPAAVRVCWQVHRTGIAAVAAGEPGEPLRDTDGVATGDAGVPLMTLSADCPLVLVYDPVRHVVGMAHASWRCTVGRIAAKLVGLLAARFDVRPADLLAGIGPGAGPCCYEVQGDVYAAAATLAGRDRLFEQRAGRLFFDLWQANQAQLIEAGVPAERVEVGGLCTMCRPDLFYSYRREGAGCGHFGLMALLRQA